MNIYLTVRSKNYFCGVNLTIEVVEKLTPRLSFPELSFPCNGKVPDLTGSTAQMTASYNGKPVPGTFEIRNTSSLQAQADKAGLYHPGVTFTPEDLETYRVVLSSAMNVRIEKAPVAVTAPSPTVKKGGPMPALTPTVSGLAEGERLGTEPVVTCTAQDTGTEETFEVNDSGALVPNTTNYNAEIVYIPGALTVKPAGGGGPVNPPVDPDPDNPDPPLVDPDDPNEGLKVKLEVAEDFKEVPPALRELEHLNTPEKLTRAMRTVLTQAGLPEGNTVVYDVTLMVSTDGGKTWVPATPQNFPLRGLRVTLPYPEGTGAEYRFTVVHMFTSTAFGKTPGETERFGPDEVENTEESLQVTLTGLSPVSIGWTEPPDPPKPPKPSVRDDDEDNDRSPASPTYPVEVRKTDYGSVSASHPVPTGEHSTPDRQGPGRLPPGDSDCCRQLWKLTSPDGQGRWEIFLYNARSGEGISQWHSLTEQTKEPISCDGGESCLSQAFADLKQSDWCHEAVDFMLLSSLMSGYDNGRFGPDERLTRAQFAQILYNKEDMPVVTGSSVFTDVTSNASCAPAVAWAAERGIVNGYGGGLFGPDDSITREQLAVMLWRYVGSPAAPDGNLTFTDAERIGAHAREALRRLVFLNRICYYFSQTQWSFSIGERTWDKM